MALLALAALAAGFVDAVVGGGELIQLPALVLGLPSASPVQVLATNKLGSICGTSVSSVTYYRRVRPHAGTFVPLMLFAFTLVGLLGYAFLEASAKARMANWATNLAALSVFVPQGAVMWRVGLVMGACNLLGGC